MGAKTKVDCEILFRRDLITYNNIKLYFIFLYPYVNRQSILNNVIYEVLEKVITDLVTATI